MANTASPSSTILLAMTVEIVGVTFLSLLAASSDELGKLVIVFMIGLWFLFLINHAGFTTWLQGILANTNKSLNG